jgi:transketolase
VSDAAHEQRRQEAMNGRTRELELYAARIRALALGAIGGLGFGHVGGIMSTAELLAVLYGECMHIDPRAPDMPDRDRFVMSKGHGGPGLYAALAIRGYFPEEELVTVNRPRTRLPSHCDMNRTPGVDMTTGSLGQGMSTAIGIALGNQLSGSERFTYLLLGDGECDEGQVWEGALFAAHHELERLIAFIDVNGKQLDGYTRDICELGDLGAKFREFGWAVQSIDGHDVAAIRSAIEVAKRQMGAPSLVLLNTVKGKGCTFAEGVLYNHHMPFSEEQLREAQEALEAEIRSRSAGRDEA